jgi:subtilisin family serine protease
MVCRNFLFIVQIVFFSPMAWAIASDVQYHLFPSGPAPIQELKRINGIESLRPIVDPSEKKYLEREGLAEVARGWVIVPSSNADQESILLKLRALGKVEIVGPSEAQIHPDQWALNNRGEPVELPLSDIDVLHVLGVKGEDVGVQRASFSTSVSRKIRIAVVDTGVDLEHPDLAGQLTKKESECALLDQYKACLNREADKDICHRRFAKLDSDGNGYPLDCRGWSVLGAVDRRTGIAGKNDPSDEVGHGTHVAGIMAAHGLVEGLAYQSIEILPVKVIGSDRLNSVQDDSSVPMPDEDAFKSVRGEADIFARGILYAIRSGAEIINLSLGYQSRDDSSLMREMIALALRKGITVVAAAGNQSSRSPVYPCIYSGVICVASYSADGSISHFSNHGDSVEIAAPGHSILSTWLRRLSSSTFTERRGWDFKNGTSLATDSLAFEP